MTTRRILLAIAIVIFLVVAFGFTVAGVNLLALGLAFFALALCF